MHEPGEIISYIEMCLAEGTSLQRGMNYHLNHGYSVILMSVRPGAPYSDRVEEDGRVLIYEGHDVPKLKNGPEPKLVDQPMRYIGGSLTQNGLFYEAVQRHKQGQSSELVRVYEKIRNGIWVYNGVFGLVDAWQENDGRRNVFKFKLEVRPEVQSDFRVDFDLEHSRFIPTSVKLEVWKRDKGRCVICGNNKNLHYDHIIPFSKGGTSLLSENIQLLCAKHNLEKRDRIE
jgi:hypothetical protein